MNSKAQQPQVVYVKQNNGCLVTAIVFVLFGWIGLIAMGMWKLAKLAWSLTVTYPLRWTMALSKLAITYSIRWTVALGSASARGAKWLTVKYGWRGWAVFSVVIVVLAILGHIVGR